MNYHPLTKGLFLLLLLCPLSATLAQQNLVVPHLPTDTQNFKVSLVFEDLVGQPRSLILHGYSLQGDLLASVSLSLDASERIIRTPTELFGEQPVTYIFIVGRAPEGEIFSTDTVTGLDAGVFLTFNGVDEGASYIPAIAQPARRWRIHPGNWQSQFDGVAVVNWDYCGGSGPRLHHYAADGTLIRTLELAPTRGPFRKAVINLAEVVEPQPGSYIEIEATFRMAVTALRGSTDFSREDRFLVGNLATPLPDFADLKRRLEEGRQRWQRSNLPYGSYQMTTRVGCFCPSDYFRSVRLTVRNNWIESMVFEDTGEPVALFQRSLYLTVDGLFDLIEQYIEKGVFDLRVTFDAEYGYPNFFSLDRDACVLDEEITRVQEGLTPIE